jgi:hypothetical protein
MVQYFFFVTLRTIAGGGGGGLDYEFGVWNELISCRPFKCFHVRNVYQDEIIAITNKQTKRRD